MSRPRKFTAEQLQSVADDRRNGMSWHKLSAKYQCAVNTVRQALSEYSDEFNPIRPTQRSELEAQLAHTQSEVDKIKKHLKKRFNLHI